MLPPPPPMPKSLVAEITPIDPLLEDMTFSPPPSITKVELVPSPDQRIIELQMLALEWVSGVEPERVIAAKYGMTPDDVALLARTSSLFKKYILDAQSLVNDAPMGDTDSAARKSTVAYEALVPSMYALAKDHTTDVKDRVNIFKIFAASSANSKASNTANTGVQINVNIGAGVRGLGGQQLDINTMGEIVNG